MEGNRTGWTVPAQLRRRAEERPGDIVHRRVQVDLGRWDRPSTAAEEVPRPLAGRVDAVLAREAVGRLD